MTESVSTWTEDVTMYLIVKTGTNLEKLKKLTVFKFFGYNLS